MDSAFTVGYDIIKEGFCDIQEPLLTTGGSISVEICFLFCTRVFEIDFLAYRCLQETIKCSIVK